jgi:hypothetical protein
MMLQKRNWICSCSIQRRKDKLPTARIAQLCPPLIWFFGPSELTEEEKTSYAKQYNASQSPKQNLTLMK